MLILLLPHMSVAAPQQASLSYQGRIFRTDGTPLSGSIQFRIQIRSPLDTNCLMFEEERTVPIAPDARGAFSFAINSPGGTRLDPGLYNFEEIFSNRKPFAYPPADCIVANPFVPEPFSNRLVIVSFNDGGAWETLPSMPTAYAPQAIDSLKVEGYGSGDLLRVDRTAPTDVVNAFTYSDYTKLVDLIAGRLNGKTLPALTTGQVLGVNGSGDWQGVTPLTAASIPDCAAGEYLRGSSGSLVCAAVTASGTGSVTSVGLTVPSYMTAGPAITTAGDIALDFAAQAANTVFAGPSSGSSVPSFRTLSIADIKSTVAGNFFAASGACPSGQTLTYSSVSDSISCAAYSITNAQALTAIGYTPVNVAGDVMTGALGLPVDGLTVGISQLVASGGNIGIGTATPAARLDVSGAGDASAIIVPRDGTRPTVGVNGMIRYNTSTNSLEAFAAGSWQSLAGSGTGAYLPLVGGTMSGAIDMGGQTLRGGSAASASLTLDSTSNATKGSVLINPTGGSVGIGTTSVKHRFQVGSSATVAQIGQDNGLLLSTGNDGRAFVGSNLYQDEWNGIRTATSNGGGYGYAGVSMTYGTVSLYTGGGNTTADAVVTPVTRMIVDASGNVGIGTTAPTSALDINGAETHRGLASVSVSPAGQGRIYFDSATNKYLVSQNGSAYTDLLAAPGGGALSSLTAATATNTIDNLNFNQTWNWSTANTGTPLSISANGLTAGSVLSLSSSNTALNSTNGLLSVANTGTSTNGMIARVQANSTAGSGLSVLANGRVGIGSATPASGLDVVGTGDASAIIVPRDGTRPTVGVNGMIRYNTSANALETFANGSWQNLAGAGAGAYLPLAGGTMSGAIDMGGQALNGGSTASASLTLDSTSNATKGVIALNPSGGSIAIGTTTALTPATMQLSSSVFTPSQVSIEHPAASGLAEVLTTWKVSDSSNLLRVTNSLTTNGSFAPSFSFRNLDSSPTSFVIGSEMLPAGDTGSLPAIRIVGSTRDASQNFQNLASRPILEVANNNLSLLSINANGNIGIGTVSPAARLDVVGTGDASAIIVPRDGTRPTVGVNGMLRYNTGTNSLEAFANGSWQSLAGGGTGAYLPLAGGTMSGAIDMGGNAIRGGSAASASLTFDSTSNATKGYVLLNPTGGNVGIGTTAPTQKLDVAGVIKSQASNLDGATTTYRHITFSTGGVSRWASGISTLSDEAGADAGADYRITRYSDAGTYIGAAVTILRSNGNVGIGNNGPTVSLDIGARTDALRVPSGNAAQQPGQSGQPAAANGMIRYNTGTNALEAFANGSWQSLAGAGTGAYLPLAGGTMSGSIDMGGQTLRGGSAAGSSLTLDSTSNAAKGSVAINPTGGNVGIGTNYPASSLHVSSTGYTQQILESSGSGAGAELDVIGFGAGAQGIIAIGASGGTKAAPTFLAAEDEIGYLSWGSGHGGAQAGRIYMYADANWSSTSTPGRMSFQTTAPSSTIPLERMVLDSNGSLGIGIDSPQAALDVVASGDASAIIVPRAGTRPTVGVNGMIRYNTSFNVLEGYIAGAWTSLGGSGGGGSFLPLAGGTMTGAIDMGGQRINGGSAASASLTLDSTSNATKGIVSINPSGGFVGIGTSSANAALTVTGTRFLENTLGVQQILTSTENYNANPTAGILFSNKYTSAGATAGTGAIASGKENTTNSNLAGYTALYTRPAGGNLTERMRVDSIGQVGINTTAPLSQLHVRQNTTPVSSGGLTTTFAAGGWQGTLSATGNTTVQPGDWITTSTSNQTRQVFYVSGTTIWIDPANPFASAVSAEAFTIYHPIASFYTGATRRMMIQGYTGKIGINNDLPVAMFDIIGNTVNQSNFAIRSSILPAHTNNGTYNDTAAAFAVSSKINSARTNAGAQIGVDVTNLRNYGQTGDSGTVADLRGVQIAYGHHTTDGAAVPKTNIMTGISVQPYMVTGTADQMYDILLKQVTPGGTATVRYSMYQEDASVPNYFAGNVGIGATGPTTKLQVGGVISPSVDNTYSLGTSSLRFTELFAVNGAVNTSDLRQKRDIENSSLGLDFITKLRPVSYRWKTGGDETRHYGLIAQETEDILKGTNTEVPGIIDYDKKNDRYGIRYTELISPLIKAVQELVAKFIGLEKMQSEQGAEIAGLKEDLERVKVENALKVKELEAIRRQNAELNERLQKIEAALLKK